MSGRPTSERARVVRAVAVGLTLVIGLFLTSASPAAALDDIVLPITTITYGNEGDVIEVASVPVEAEFVGVPCKAVLIDINNESVHPGNDLIVTSGDWTDTILDVESEADSTQVIDEEMLLGETVVVEIRLGPDGVSSGGVTLTFGCDDEPPAPTCPADSEGNPVTPNDDGTCPEETGEIPTVDPPCTDADGNVVKPDADGECPAPPPEGPVDCGTNADGTPVASDADGNCPTTVDCGNNADGSPVTPDADGSCPVPVEGPPPPLQPAPTPTPTLPVTGVESSLLLGMTGLFILAAGWAIVLRPGAPVLASAADHGASSPRS